MLPPFDPDSMYTSSLAFFNNSAANGPVFNGNNANITSNNIAGATSAPSSISAPPEGTADTVTVGGDTQQRISNRLPFYDTFQALPSTD